MRCGNQSLLGPIVWLAGDDAGSYLCVFVVADREKLGEEVVAMECYMEPEVGVPQAAGVRMRRG